MRHKELGQESQPLFLESPSPFPLSLLHCHHLDFSETIKITRETIFSGNREPDTVYTETLKMLVCSAERKKLNRRNRLGATGFVVLSASVSIREKQLL